MIPKCAACGRPMLDLASVKVKLSKCGRHATFYCEKHPLTPEPTPELAEKLTDALQHEIAEREYEQQDEQDQDLRAIRSVANGPALLRQIANRRR